MTTHLESLRPTIVSYIRRPETSPFASRAECAAWVVETLRLCHPMGLREPLLARVQAVEVALSDDDDEAVDLALAGVVDTLTGAVDDKRR
jgi:hypothetical protein